MYFDLFKDCLISSLFFTFESEFVLTAMLSFGSFDKKIAFVSAVSGGLLGLIINWLLGFLLIWYLKNKRKLSEKLLGNYQKLSAGFNKKFVWLLLFSGIGFSSLLFDLDISHIKGVKDFCKSPENTMTCVREYSNLFFITYSGMILAVLGGAMTFFAGFLRTPLLKFLLLVSLSKGLYYFYLISSVD